MTHRDEGLSLGAVESEVQRSVLVVESKQTLGPEGGDEVSVLEPPVETEHPVEVQSQTAAVVHQHSQLLPLESKTNCVRSPLARRRPAFTWSKSPEHCHHYFHHHRHKCCPSSPSTHLTFLLLLKDTIHLHIHNICLLMLTPCCLIQLSLHQLWVTRQCTGSSLCSHLSVFSLGSVS